MAEIDIVIVEYKTPEKTIAAAKSFLLHTPENIQIVIVDNSEDGQSTKKIFESLKQYPNILILPTRKNLGYGKGCNLGAALSPKKYPYVIFSNCDVEVTAKYWEPLKEVLDKPKVFAVGPKLLNHSNKIVGCGVVGTDKNRILRGWMSPANQFNQTEEVISLSGALFACHRKIFEELGQFNPIFPHYFEETALFLEARLKGYQIWYCGSSVVKHEVHGTCRDTIKLQKVFQQSKKLFDEKYKDILR